MQSRFYVFHKIWYFCMVKDLFNLIIPVLSKKMILLAKKKKANHNKKWSSKAKQDIYSKIEIASEIQLNNIEKQWRLWNIVYIKRRVGLVLHLESLQKRATYWTDILFVIIHYHDLYYIWYIEEVEVIQNRNIYYIPGG
jgi:hypothetical protein